MYTVFFSQRGFIYFTGVYKSGYFLKTPSNRSPASTNRVGGPSCRAPDPLYYYYYYYTFVFLQFAQIK